MLVLKEIGSWKSQLIGERQVLFVSIDYHSRYRKLSTQHHGPNFSTIARHVVERKPVTVLRLTNIWVSSLWGVTARLERGPIRPFRQKHRDERQAAMCLNGHLHTSRAPIVVVKGNTAQG